MREEFEIELRAAIDSAMPLDGIVELLRRFKEKGATREEVYSFLGSLREKAHDESRDDRIVEVSDFVAGFCSPHMKIWAG